MKKVFIDGGAGTTGLRIAERLAGRSDLQILTLPEEKRKDSAAKKAYCVKSERKGAKAAALNLSVLAERDGMSLVAVRLETGRFHQIRVQLASRANPLVGDKKYGSRDTKVRTPSLFASRLDFTLSLRNIKADALPPTDEYPWSLFDIKGMECLYGGLL